MIRKYIPKAMDPIIFAWILGVSAAVLVAGSMILIPVWLRSARVQDTEHATLKTAIAKVVAVTYQAVRKADPNPAPYVTLQIDGHVVTAPRYEPVVVGQMVRVRYYVGKSGKVYVEKILSDSDP